MMKTTTELLSDRLLNTLKTASMSIVRPVV